MCVFVDRLRNKWSDALSNRREFLDTEVRKVMEKRDRTEIDTQRENELIDQWTMLQVGLLVSLAKCVASFLLPSTLLPVPSLLCGG